MAKRTSNEKLRKYIHKVVEEEVNRVLGSREPEQRMEPDDLAFEPPVPPEPFSQDFPQQPLQTERLRERPPEQPFESNTEHGHQPPPPHWDAPGWPPLHEPRGPYPVYPDSRTHRKNRR